MTGANGTAESNQRLLRLSVVALGVVFGDIATSPIYAIRACFSGDYGIPVSQANVLGILSLMFWSLVMIVGVKYLIFVFRADNNGEGGVIALTTLLHGSHRRGGLRAMGVVALGLFAACLLYGDGMITPAISVLSAVEGIEQISPQFTPWVIPLTIAILVGLFLIQRRGTARVGGLFGPVIMVWLTFLAATGAVQIARTPAVLAALSPWHGIEFLAANRLHGVVTLGAVFLVVTGAEALYADMGHFGTRPIRLTWFAFVFPALVLNYFGQGALLLVRPEAVGHPFFSLVPSWALTPTVLLATLATIIASQAVISGAFSLTRQAMLLGYLPRLSITHTAASQAGQIYVAPVNWMLMCCAILLVVGFGSSGRLAAAYGVAVTSTMLITTTLFALVALRRWRWSAAAVGLLCAVFYVVDLPFFFANISKVVHGAWFPLAIGFVFFVVMLTWSRGRGILHQELHGKMPPLERFIAELPEDSLVKLEGDAVFLTSSPDAVPVALAKNIRHNRVVHGRTVLLHFAVEDVPRIPSFEKVEVEKLGRGFHRVVAHFGFMEHPELDSVLALARDNGLDPLSETTSYYIGHENLVRAPESAMQGWRTNLFLFMSRNAANASSFFTVPPEQVIEVGVRVEV